MRRMTKRTAIVVSLVGTSLVGMMTMTSIAEACTRFVSEAGDDRFITGRSMDWVTDVHSDLWVYPRGLVRDGGIGDKPIKWVSKYGSVTLSAFDAGTADGMNEKGLVANLLYLVEADYGELNGKPSLSVGAWAQYILDNYATVAEAVKGLESEPFKIIPTPFPDGAVPGLHVSISDPSGDSAIFEYIDGELVIHHGEEYPVMTNSPSFDQQIPINAYWKEIGGVTMLPGTNRATDRFARASYYIENSPKYDDERRAVSSAFSIIRNVSVPLGFSDPEKPNIATTVWRVVSDHKSMKYYFESTISPNVFWVDMNKLDLSEGTKPRTIDLDGHPIFAGDVSDKFDVAKPFKWLAPDSH